MPNVCRWKAPLVTLLDGRQVPSDSPEWREQCEAQHILNMPYRLDRIEALDLIEKRRGKPARLEIEKRVIALWKAQRRPTDAASE